jgi:hypothetical protein
VPPLAVGSGQAGSPVGSVVVVVVGSLLGAALVGRPSVVLFVAGSAATLVPVSLVVDGSPPQ